MNRIYRVRTFTILDTYYTYSYTYSYKLRRYICTKYQIRPPRYISKIELSPHKFTHTQPC
jgi:hypothetical protein